MKLPKLRGPKPKATATLHIRRNRTDCGGCGEMADPEESVHAETFRDGHVVSGCGAIFDSVTGSPSLRREIEALRPDLEWRDS